MPIDPHAVGAEAGPVTYTWTSDDCLLYALAVGAADEDLSYVTENTRDLPQRVLPTFAVVAGAGAPLLKLAGDFDRSKLVHGEQGVELAGPIHPSGAVQSTSRITGIYDKGKGAVVETESTSVDAETGELRFTTRRSVFIRGAGGFGGESGGGIAAGSMPGREPDHVIEQATQRNQALLYRLTGDRNPLHSDPVFAARGGFAKPILHGLCTYGFAGRVLLNLLCGGDPSRFVSMAGRFTAPVLPGEQLAVDVWETGEGEAAFRMRTTADGRVVLDQGSLVYAPGSR